MTTTEPAERNDALLDSKDAAKSIPACFARLAALHPRLTALGSGAWQPSYEELDRAANRLAGELISTGGAPGERVAVLMEHDTPLVAAALAILKAGKIVVVLNPSDPPARMGQVWKDAEPGLLLTDETNWDLAGQIAGPGRGVICIENPGAGGAACAPEIPISPNDVAFLVYTSGTTGRPKGVMQTHRHILHKAWRISRGLDTRPGDRMTLLGSLSGGLGVNASCFALLNGITLCPFPIMTKGVTGLADWMESHAITIYYSSASVFRSFAASLERDRRIDHLRYVWLTSEPVMSGDFQLFVNHFGGSAQFVNALSSSETGHLTMAHFSRTDRVADGLLPVGHVAEGVEVKVIDEAGGEAPRGETGQIVVRSPHLSPGYWRNEAQTDLRFFNAPDGGRMFKSGDMGRFNEDGQLLYLGRKDGRVKINGYGVEISEIEETLLAQAAVAQALVCLVERPRGETLAAYLILRPGRKVSSEDLRRALEVTLPRYMIPAEFVFLQNFPLTPHGKIDREELKQLSPAEPSHAQAEEPVTETEQLLAGIWSSVFPGQSIGRQSSFFLLGGDSLIAAVVAARVHAATRAELDLRAFAEHPTLAGLAARIDVLDGPARIPRPLALPMARASRERPLPMSFSQERLWRLSQTPEASAGWTQFHIFSIRGALNVEVLRESMSRIIRRHEILRTSFTEEDGLPVQIIHPPCPVSLEVLDYSAMADGEDRAHAFFARLASEPYDVSRLPLMRFWLIRIGEDEHWLFRSNHHILSDGGSWTVYFRELGLLYEAALQGVDAPLEEMALQYGDYSVWQRQVYDPKGPEFQAAIGWWRDLLAAPHTPLAVPFRRHQPLPEAPASEAFIYFGPDASISRRLDELGRGEGATFYIVRLAFSLALLAGACGQEDLVAGLYVSNRQRPEVQDMFGFFVNLVTLRIKFDPSQSFRQWLKITQERFHEIQARAEIPHESLGAELAALGVTPPEIRLIFNMTDSTRPVSFGGLELTYRMPQRDRMPWGLSLSVDSFREDSQCRLAFDARIYDPAGARAFLQTYVGLLEAVSLQPDRPLAELMGACSTTSAIGAGTQTSPVH